MNILKQSIEATINQGERSVFLGFCQYRHGELKCSIGHLITDEHYSRELEDCSLELGNKIHDALNKSLGYEVDAKEVSQLKKIQGAHDGARGSDFLVDFKNRILINTARGYLPKELRELVR
jgi:hypothetical protein